MKVLITGGAGFIAGWLAQKLRKRGDEIVLFDVRRPIDSVWVEGTQFFERDVRNRGTLKRDLEVLKPEYVLHLAAMADTRDCLEYPQDAWRVNVIGTENLLGACKELGIKSLFASTSLLSSVMNGPDFGSVDEHVMMAMSPDVYCATKQAGEAIARRCGSVICRFGICYGPSMTPGVLFEIFVRRALKGEVLYLDGGGLIKRQYLYVEDLADGVIKAMEGSGVYHVVPHWWTTPKDVAEQLQKMLPHVEIEEREGRAGEIVCGPMLRNTRLVWQPEVTLAEGLKRTIEWYKIPF